MNPLGTRVQKLCLGFDETFGPDYNEDAPKFQFYT